MATLTLIIGSIALLAGAFTTWYMVWHLRIESRLERFPAAGRSVHVLRKDGAPGGDPR